MINKKKAIVLGGGGSLGAYQVGCFKYLHEIGYEYDIVYGTSIGSVNGLVMSQGLESYPYLQELWDNITIKDITDDDIEMYMNFESMLNTIKSVKDITTKLGKNIKTLGANTDNFYNFLTKKIDINKVLNSPIDFKLNTINITAPHILVTDKRRMGNKLIDYVIASCSATPVLQPHKIKYGLIYNWYVDGGFNDNLMIDQALKDGYEDILAIDLVYLKPTHEEYMNDPRVKYIFPSEDLGSFFTFDHEVLSKNMEIGYKDIKEYFEKK